MILHLPSKLPWMPQRCGTHLFAVTYLPLVVHIPFKIKLLTVQVGSFGFRAPGCRQGAPLKSEAYVSPHDAASFGCGVQGLGVFYAMLGPGCPTYFGAGSIDKHVGQILKEEADAGRSQGWRKPGTYPKRHRIYG